MQRCTRNNFRRDVRLPHCTHSNIQVCCAVRLYFSNACTKCLVGQYGRTAVCTHTAAALINLVLNLVLQKTPQVDVFSDRGACFWPGRIATEPEHKRAIFHSDKVLGGSAPGILPVSYVNWQYTRCRTLKCLIDMRIWHVCVQVRSIYVPTKKKSIWGFSVQRA